MEAGRWGREELAKRRWDENMRMWRRAGCKDEDKERMRRRRRVRSKRILEGRQEGTFPKNK